MRTAITVAMKDRKVYRRAGDLVIGKWKPDKPIDLRAVSGRKLYDVVFDEQAFVCYVSERVVGVLRGNGFTGWDLFPVALYVKDELQTGYHGLATNGQCGPIVQLKNPRVRYAPPPPEPSYEAWIRYYFEPSTWDGADVFHAADQPSYIMTLPVKAAMLAAKITNFSILPLAEKTTA